MNQDLINSLVEEALRISRPSIIDDGFPKQAEFIRDPAKRKALWCTRRSAKSYTGGIYLSDTAATYPECNTLYLGLTRLAAKAIVWKDILKQIDRKHNLGMEFNGSELTATLPNGSVIYVAGVDANEDEMHKLLGRKWKLVVIDEAQSLTIDARTLVYGVLGPSVVDQGGTICLMGTAGNLTTGLFYDVSRGKEPGWKLFEWTAYDNPYVAKQWAEEIEDIKTNRPLFQETSLFKQWYLNQWVIDDAARVYRFSEDRNSYSGMPAVVDPWRYILGIDLAHSPDSSAFVVGAYTTESPLLRMVYAHKFPKFDITDVANHVRKLEEKWSFDVKIVDGANKQAVAELNNRHGMNLICADKTGKVDFIRLMNDEFIQGKILLGPDTEQLSDEYAKLIWMTDANGHVIEPRKEHPNVHNDLCDAALYLWRHAYQYLFQAMPEVLPHDDQARWEPEHISKLQDQVRNSLNKNELSLDWDETWDNQLEEENEF